MPKIKLLFICSRNQWRSPTAEAIFKGDEKYEARSAGTENSARIRISSKLLQWSDMIFVMEKKHKVRLMEKFSSELEEKPIIVLDIPDDYRYMDDELVAMLQISLTPYLSNFEPHIRN